MNHNAQRHRPQIIPFPDPQISRLAYLLGSCRRSYVAALILEIERILPELLPSSAPPLPGRPLSRPSMIQTAILAVESDLKVLGTDGPPVETWTRDQVAEILTQRAGALATFIEKGLPDMAERTAGKTAVHNAQVLAKFFEDLRQAYIHGG